MKKNRSFILIALLVGLIFTSTVCAQGEEELKLSMSRDFGYSSGTGDIQGTFSMKVTGPDTLVSVQFYIDETMIAEDTEPPFKVQFTTDSYPLGMHTMYAVGLTSDGRELRTREVSANFVTADEGWQAALKIMGPVLGLVLIAALLSAIVPALGGRGKKGQLLPPGERNYGIVGGTICPRCSFPFALNIMAPNMLVGKLVRCPNCGKWFVGRSASKDALRSAEEAAWAQAHGAPQVSEMTEEEKLQKELDDSKFQGM
jgi:hypothetical protein